MSSKFSTAFVSLGRRILVPAPHAESSVEEAPPAITAPDGLGIGVAVFTVFLLLKIAGIGGLSWWWVTAPLWLWLGFQMVDALATGLSLGVAKFIEAVEDRRYRKYVQRLLRSSAVKA